MGQASCRKYERDENFERLLRKTHSNCHESLEHLTSSDLAIFMKTKILPRKPKSLKIKNFVFMHIREEYADMKNDLAQKEVMKDWDFTAGEGINENEW